jgi:protein-S-isoprenylcysteine O-methyltransferase Ste14
MKDESKRPRTLVLPPAPFGAAMVGGWWMDRDWRPLPLNLGVVAQPIGGVLIALGLSLFVWALYTLYRHHTTVNPYRGARELCMDGPFRLTRNPIYLGDWLILVGVALWLRTWWPLLFAPLIWPIIRYGVIRHEEAHLESRFGEAYRRYRARVRRWL